MKRKHRVLKTVLIIVILLLVLVAAAVTVCAVLALQDPYADKYSTTDTVDVDANLIASVAEAAVFGKDYTADDQEFNSYIRKLLDSSEDSRLKDLALYFHEDNKAEIYGRINMDIPWFNYTGDFGVYCEAEFKLDETDGVLEMTLSNAKLGMLPLPDSVLGDALSEKLAKLSDELTVEGTTVRFPVSFETTVEGIDIKVSLESFSSSEGSVTIRSNKVLTDTLDSATDKAKQWIAEHEDELQEYGDELSQWIDENKDKLSEYESEAEEWVESNRDTISEYGEMLEDWASENSETVSEYTEKAKDWLKDNL